MAGRSHLLELDSDLVLNQRLLQSLAGLMNETLSVAQDIAQYCPDENNLKRATQDIMLSFINMEDEIKQYTAALNHVKKSYPLNESGSSTAIDLAGDERGESLTAAFTQKLEQLMASNSRDESRLTRHSKYVELETMLASGGDIEAELATLRTTLAGTAGDSQGELAMTEVEINTRCPYTGCTMQDPVVNKRCGHIYDREGILAHIKQKKNKANSFETGCLAKVYTSVDQLSERVVVRTINPEHDEISHRQFHAAMKQTVSTDYPFSHAISELDEAASLECELCNDCVVVRDGGETERVVQNNSCDCIVFVSKCLPFRRLMAKDMPPLDLTMFSPRWMRCNQNITAHPAGRVNVSIQNFKYSMLWSKARKFNTTKGLVLEIADKISELGMPTFLYYSEQLRQFEKNISLQRDGFYSTAQVNRSEDGSGVAVVEGSGREVTLDVDSDDSGENSAKPIGTSGRPAWEWISRHSGNGEEINGHRGSEEEISGHTDNREDSHGQNGNGKEIYGHMYRRKVIDEHRSSRKGISRHSSSGKGVGGHGSSGEASGLSDTVMKRGLVDTVLVGRQVDLVIPMRRG